MVAREGVAVLFGNDADILLLRNNKELAALLEDLSRFPFFQNISPESLAELLRSAELEEFKKDDIIIRQGEPGSKLYIVAEGKVNILNDTGISISTLEQAGRKRSANAAMVRNFFILSVRLLNSHASRCIFGSPVRKGRPEDDGVGRRVK